VKTRNVTRVGKRNQVTIPAAMLRVLGLGPGEAVRVAQVDGRIEITPAEDPVARAYGMLRKYGAPVLTNEELLQVIEEARQARAAAAEEDDARIRDGRV
jgi:AbrB family looped-hinge helix DNA binding protein